MDPDCAEAEEIIEEFLLDNSMEERRLQLFNQLYGEGSSSTPRRVINRDREAAHNRLVRDYFAAIPVYPLETFQRRFRMGRHIFLRIVDALSNIDPYFQQRVDALGRKGLSPLQKCTAAMRMLAYGISADAVDDYVRIGESTAIECLKKFVTNIILIFESEYLRKPNLNDVQRLLKMGEDRGFPGMMGSIDCMHWQWKNCPKAWKGMFMSGHKGVPTILLEAVASSDLWIWHAFFGVAGSNNDINVLDRSPIFDEVLEGRAPEVNYNVNGNDYNMGYYLTDGIYPECATFVKTIPRPQGDKRRLFSKYQEGQRKDVERAFGVLQSRFAIIRGPARFWDKKDLAKIMRACIILHNMIVEDERDTYATPFGSLPTYDDATNGLSQPNLEEEPFAPYERYIQNNVRIRDRQKHRQLQADLIEHISQFHNNR
nr:PREDICTED: putative nuclease HARBI1 [Daucus carota subsp. sativus]